MPLHLGATSVMPLSRLGPLTVMVATLPYIKLAALMFVPSTPPQATNKTLIAHVVVTNLSVIISFLLLLQTLRQRLCLCLSLRTIGGSITAVRDANQRFISR